MNQPEKVLCVIPARGGSKSIPIKNIKYICGQPLINWTIQAAAKSRYINRVVVSTDSDHIADVSKKAGAEVIRRPLDISGDTSSSESALLHAIDFLAEEENYHPDLLVFLQCTSPLTDTDDIDGTIECLKDKQADTALAVTKFHYFIWRQEHGVAKAINHDASVRPMRQEREQQFIETGSVYVMRVEGFKLAKHRFFGKIVMHEIPAERCLEIDEPIDLTIAEIRLRRIVSNRRRKLLPSPVAIVIFDFDGVFTDNTVSISEHGDETVTCNRSDGWGLSQFRLTEVPILVLSTERNPIVAVRCQKLGLTYHQGLDKKVTKLRSILDDMHIDINQAIYVGNDMNDLDCMQAVGCSIAVADAHPDLMPFAKIVLENKGGCGAIRELCDLLMSHMQETSQKFPKHLRI